MCRPDRPLERWPSESAWAVALHCQRLIVCLTALVSPEANLPGLLMGSAWAWLSGRNRQASGTPKTSPAHRPSMPCCRARVWKGVYSLRLLDLPGDMRERGIDSRHGNVPSTLRPVVCHEIGAVSARWTSRCRCICVAAAGDAPGVSQRKTALIKAPTRRSAHCRVTQKRSMSSRVSTAASSTSDVKAGDCLATYRKDPPAPSCFRRVR